MGMLSHHDLCTLVPVRLYPSAPVCLHWWAHNSCATNW